MLFDNKPLLIAVILFIILLMLLIITAGSGNISGVPSVLGGVLEPVQGAFYTATEAIVGFFSGFVNDAELEAENIALKEQVAELSAEISELAEMRMENERLRSLLQYKQENTKFETVTARVTGRSPGQWFVVFTINSGVSSGIKKDMAVINAQGLIGRVIDTGANWAKVMAIIDPLSGVAGIVERTRDNGTVKGTVATEGTPTMTMVHLPLDADLMPGDKVITSGLGGVFPKGIPIGTVLEVSQGRDNAQTNAKIMPAVDFVHLEEVMVITSQTEEG